jgi:hypothetical protein
MKAVNVKKGRAVSVNLISWFSGIAGTKEQGAKRLKNKKNLTPRRLTTPKAAAVAGILFALLTGVAYILIRLAIPVDLAEQNGVWLKEQAGPVSFALGLVPFAGIAFLWFIGVVRDRIGRFEDRFFSSVFFGSGLLYLALIFIAAAMTAGLITSYAFAADKLIESGLYFYTRALIWQIQNIYAIRMASVFMISLGTIWVRTRIMPLWLALLTYISALVLMFTVSYNVLVTLVFPFWVLVISVYILFLNLYGGSITPENQVELSND